MRGRHLTHGHALEEVGFAAAVAADETVAPPDGELDGALLDELDAVEAEAEAVDLDVSGRGARRQHARDGPHHPGRLLALGPPGVEVELAQLVGGILKQRAQDAQEEGRSEALSHAASCYSQCCCSRCPWQPLHAPPCGKELPKRAALWNKAKKASCL